MDGQTKADLIRLTKQRQGIKALDDPATPAPVLSSTSIGRPAGTTTAGISGTLTEPDASTRQYFSDESITTTDGVFIFVVKPIQQIDMVSNGQPVTLIFDNPFSA